MRNFIDIDNKRVLVTNYNSVDMKNDEYTRVNCHGYGRIRQRFGHTFQLNSHFFEPKPLNRKAQLEDSLRTQTFQLAACNLKCWFCYVDKCFYEKANEQATFMTADDLLFLYLSIEDAPTIIELSGGEPDLAPEWCLWFMQAIESRSLQDKIHIWTETNLSTYGVWEYLSKTQIDYILSYPNHNRVGCLKGIDDFTCALNSQNSNLSLQLQLSILKKYINTGFTMYLYVCFTAPDGYIDEPKMRYFMKSLQSIDYGLPLRTVPLKIQRFTSNESVFNEEYEKEQYQAFCIWHNLLLKEYGDLTRLGYDESYR